MKKIAVAISFKTRKESNNAKIILFGFEVVLVFKAIAQMCI